MAALDQIRKGRRCLENESCGRGPNSVQLTIDLCCDPDGLSCEYCLPVRHTRPDKTKFNVNVCTWGNI